MGLIPKLFTKNKRESKEEDEGLPKIDEPSAITGVTESKGQVTERPTPPTESDDTPPSNEAAPPVISLVTSEDESSKADVTIDLGEDDGLKESSEEDPISDDLMGIFEDEIEEDGRLKGLIAKVEDVSAEDLAEELRVCAEEMGARGAAKG